MNIEEILSKLPASPGVYIMKGKEDEVIYIGKAKNLRSRVRSYFREQGDTRYTVKFLVARVEDIGYIVTANEKEALFLEDTLLKQHKPKYNIQLKDSKTYVSIKITVKDKFPRILVTRQIKKDGSRYFGPYTSARDVRDTIKFIRRIFPLCVCSASVFNNRVRPCLDFQMGICSAPAVGLIFEEAYRDLVNSAILFLEGKNKELVRHLWDKMNEAAAALDFEKAAKIRDQIAAIEHMLEKQKVVTHKAVDQDVFAFIREKDSIIIQALFIRDGRLVSSQDYYFHELGLPDDEIISSFITQFYRGERYVPDEVILPIKLEDSPVIEEWLADKKGRKAPLIVPERGDRTRLLEMALENAREALRKRTEQQSAKSDLLFELKNRLHLRNTPNNIEAFDISNIGGKQAVGAMVNFKQGAPDKNSYRLFKIKGLEGPDDYAMMYQVLSRRYKHAADEKTEQGEEKALPLPDLIMVDGGKGQLNIAVEVLHELGITGVDIAALAKDREDDRLLRKGKAPKGERIFRPNVKDPVHLREGSKPDLLLRRIRDEVHRFAISYHRKLRSKEVASLLEKIPGIGDKKRKALFQRFGDLEAMANASTEELMEVQGITEALALSLKEALKEFKSSNEQDADLSLISEGQDKF